MKEYHEYEEDTYGGCFVCGYPFDYSWHCPSHIKWLVDNPTVSKSELFGTIVYMAGGGIIIGLGAGLGIGAFIF